MDYPLYQPYNGASQLRQAYDTCGELPATQRDAERQQVGTRLALVPLQEKFGYWTTSLGGAENP